MKVTLFLFVVAASVSASVIGVTIANRDAIDALRVGSPLYLKIVQGKDLVADILPPPEYVIEPYLEATLAMREPASAAAHEKNIARLKKDFDDRHAYWAHSGVDASIQSSLTKSAYRPAQEFFEILSSTLLPALKRDDTPAAEAAYAKLTEAYTRHRAAIDETVAKTNRLNTTLETDAAEKDAYYKNLSFAVAFLSGVFSLACLYIVRVKVAAPLVEMTRTMNALTQGSTGVSLDAGYELRRDEIGDMARALRVLEQEVRTNAQLREVADSVRDGADSTISSTTRQMGAMTDDAVAMAECATQVRSASTAATAATEQALQSTNLIASATEQLTNSIREIVDKVTTVAGITSRAVDAGTAAKGKISHLSDVVTRISEVVSLISEIATQTNLLALNATIEAARAGEAGKGFAVVANEVKQLSTQTTRSTEDIRRQIDQVVQATSETVSATDAIQKLVLEIDDASAAIASVMREQGSATEEIARNATQSMQAVQDMTEAISTVNTVADQAMQKAMSVKSAAARVSETVSMLGSVVIRMVQSTAGGINRRAMNRFRIDVDAVAEGCLSGSLIVRNISLGGALLRTTQTPEAGATGRLRVGNADIPFMVLSREPGTVHVKFPGPVDEAARAAIRKLTLGKEPLEPDAWAA